jgi:hypothetical protein
MAIVIITENEDRKGIGIRISHDVEPHEVIVEVFYQPKIIGSELKIKSTCFPGNRWGLQMPDSVKAVEIGVMMAEELEKELGL